jgi:hypothetical protein
MDVRTEGQGVAETAWQFTRFVLHPSQLNVLNSNERLLFLVSAPGCGKTLCLVLKGLDWLDQGKHVMVASFTTGSLAASHMIHDQLQRTAGQAASARLHFHSCQLSYSSRADFQASAARAVSAMMAASHNGELFILVDEASYVQNRQHGAVY